MKFKTLTMLSIVLLSNFSIAQTDLIFKNGMELVVTRLNDTGITWAAEYPEGNNTDCTSATITAPQDCNHGRDFTHNDDSDGAGGFSFTKLDASGTPLADQSVDYTTTPWACVHDNVTELTWEVKTTIAGIHNKDNTYQWGGLTAIGRNHPNRQGMYYDPSWNELVNGSNTNTLCGFNNWRVPTLAELSSVSNKGTNRPSIDINYFPNTASNSFWSSSPFANFPDFTWYISFTSGTSNGNQRDKFFRVRLVRSGQ